jgi:hypothetical protein
LTALAVGGRSDVLFVVVELVFVITKTPVVVIEVPVIEFFV